MNKTSIFVIGYPKSGTCWLARLLGDALNSRVTTLAMVNGLPSEGADRPGDYLIRHGHARPDALLSKWYKPGDKIVYIVRDPRDTVISNMFYWKCPSVQAAIGRVVSRDKAGAGVHRHVRKWLRHEAMDAATSYEDLSQDSSGALSLVLWLLDILPSSEDISKAVERQSFDQRRAWTKEHGDTLVFGKEKQLEYLRKGIVGDWRNHFTFEDGLIMQERLGELLVSLEYVEAGDEWWKGLRHA